MFILKVVLGAKGDDSIISVCILQVRQLVIDDFKAGGNIMWRQAMACNFSIKNSLEFHCFSELVDSGLDPLLGNTFDFAQKSSLIHSPL